MLEQRMELHVLDDRVRFSWRQERSKEIECGIIVPEKGHAIMQEIGPHLRLSIVDYSQGGYYIYELLLWRDGDNWQEFVRRGMKLMLAMM